MTTDRIKVFIVDDHPLVREWLGNLLRLEKDIEVVGEAEEPEPALAAMEAQRVDVVVVDLTLKRGSGLDLIKAIRLRSPATRALVLSMHEEISDVERALRAGARGYVMKGEATSEIVQAIRQVHTGKVYADTQILARLAERMVGRLPHDEHDPAEALSDRELDVFRRIGAGHSTRCIAEDLGCTTAWSSCNPPFAGTMTSAVEGHGQASSMPFPSGVAVQIFSMLPDIRCADKLLVCASALLRFPSAIGRPAR